jgi:hypothetical protein
VTAAAEPDQGALHEFLTLDAAADEAGMTRLALQRAIHAGRLRSVWWPAENLWCIERAELARYLGAGR